MAAGLDLTLKIGGCEALTDLDLASRLGVRRLVAPMIESPYALHKYLNAVDRTFSADERSDLEVFINLETVTGVEQFERMLMSPGSERLDGVVIGRADLAGSLGLSRAEVEDPAVQERARAIALKARHQGLRVGVGGSVTPGSLEGFRALPALDFFETRKVLFACPAGLEHGAAALAQAFAFELAWLENKRDRYGRLRDEDDERIAELRRRSAGLASV